MAQLQRIQLVDGLTGGTADETVEFGIDGRRYVINLSSSNANALRAVIATYATAGRRRRGHRQSADLVDAPAPSSRAGRARNRAIRKWAREQGMTISDQGRLPTTVLAAYRAAGTGADAFAGRREPSRPPWNPPHTWTPPYRLVRSESVQSYLIEEITRGTDTDPCTCCHQRLVHTDTGTESFRMAVDIDPAGIGQVRAEARLVPRHPFGHAAADHLAASRPASGSSSGREQ